MNTKLKNEPGPFEWRMSHETWVKCQWELKDTQTHTFDDASTVIRGLFGYPVKIDEELALGDINFLAKF